MTYRDDREATRRRAEHLASELDATRRELEEAREKVRAHEGKDVDDERRIAELTRRLEKLEGRARTPSGSSKGSPVGMWISVLVALAAGGAGFLFFGARPAPSPPPRVAPPAAAIPDPPPLPSPSPPAAPAPKPERTAQVTFHARVVKASGAPVATGASCELRAELASSGKSRDVRKVELSCGKTLLYRQGDSAGETIISMARWDFEEEKADAPGAWRYHLLFEDRGQRASTLFQISAETSKKRVRLWRDEPDRANVDLALDEWSAPREGEPLVSP